ncbi:hypothetical protein BD289DRAFT_161418 [Coniella lustricola]|uniref:Secreted protein n=1 Tax=Coniella lustricola TaxID=2025994 RepID=A0A2T2ZUE6_9PEZI|nr:hypothetical protein BD289DRAFT_161418 [Coniella lustricola]
MAVDVCRFFSFWGVLLMGSCSGKGYICDLYTVTSTDCLLSWFQGVQICGKLGNAWQSLYSKLHTSPALNPQPPNQNPDKRRMTHGHYASSLHALVTSWIRRLTRAFCEFSQCECATATLLPILFITAASSYDARLVSTQELNSTAAGCLFVARDGSSFTSLREHKTKAPSVWPISCRAN